MNSSHFRMRVYLVVAVLLGLLYSWGAVAPLLPAPRGVSQSALVAGDVPLDGRLVMGRMLFFVSVAVAGAFLAAPWVTRCHRRRCQQCIACGYVLSATPHATRCPECGHATVA